MKRFQSRSQKAVSLSLVAAISLLGSASFVACGKNASQKNSQSNFISIPKKPGFAYLEERDLKDDFVFGLTISNTENFFDSALNLRFSPTIVKLVPQQLSPGKFGILITTKDAKPSVFLKFDAKSLADGNVEVDFGSAGNDVSLLQGVNALGGQVIDSKAEWKTVGKPVVKQVVQDEDGFLVDVVHTVSATSKGSEIDASESRTGKVTIRMFLKRNRPAKLDGVRTVGEALLNNLGFFGASRGLFGFGDGNKQKELELPIARYNIDVKSKAENQVKVYLKNFPKEFYSVGENAVLSWNKAFGFNAFQVLPATAEIDLGDTRYSVVKWFNGLDKQVPWAGYAPTLVNPSNGQVISTQIMVNGDKLVQNMENLVDYTEVASKEFEKLSGKIGDVPLDFVEGETPIVSFFSDTTSESKEEFVKGYYTDVVMHEFGHTLGLRHNFAASTTLESNGLPTSIMDYAPNYIASRRTQVGQYDAAAIRFGYFGETPKEKLAFCTDENIATRIDCNQGDNGKPVDSMVTTVLNGVRFLKKSEIALPKHVEKPMKGSIATLLKMKKLLNQLPLSERDEAASQIDSALVELDNLVPSIEVANSGNNELRQLVENNLARVKLAYKEALEESKK